MKDGGVSQYFNPDGTMIEIATITCAHCQAIIEIPNKRDVARYTDFCRCCMRMTCLREECATCTPIMKKIEEAEERAYRSQQFAKALGL